MDASSASTLSTLPLSSFIAGPRLPARSSRYLGDELFVFSARAERNLVEVGKSYMKGMAEAALHQRARLLLLRGRERRRNQHPLLDFVQAALDELEPPNLWRDRLVVVVIAEVGKHRRAVRQRPAVSLAARTSVVAGRGVSE